jgi:transposase
MIRMLLVGYLYGIRSETPLCEEVHLNLAYRTPRISLVLPAWAGQ